MPPRSKLKAIFSLRKQKRSDSDSPHSGTVTPVVVDENIQPSVSNVKQDEETSLQPTRSQTSYHQEPSTKRLIVVDTAIDIMSILKEASEASEVLTPLKAVCGISIKLLEIARVSRNYLMRIVIELLESQTNIGNVSFLQALVDKVEKHYLLFAEEARRVEEYKGGIQNPTEELIDSLREYLQCAAFIWLASFS